MHSITLSQPTIQGASWPCARLRGQCLQFQLLCGTTPLDSATNVWSAMRMTLSWRVLMKASCGKWLTSPWLTCVRLRLKSTPRKCAYGVTGRNASSAPASFSVQGVELHPVSSLDILGVTVECTRTPFTTPQRTQQRHDEATKRLTALKTAKLSWASKSRAVASLVSPVDSYGAWRTRV